MFKEILIKYLSPALAEEVAADLQSAAPQILANLLAGAVQPAAPAPAPAKRRGRPPGKAKAKAKVKVARRLSAETVAKMKAAKKLSWALRHRNEGKELTSEQVKLLARHDAKAAKAEAKAEAKAAKAAKGGRRARVVETVEVPSVAPSPLAAAQARAEQRTAPNGAGVSPDLPI